MDIDDGDTVSDEHVGNVAEAGTSGIYSSSRPGSDERTADRPAPSNAISNEGNEPNAGPSVQIPSGASQDDRNADTFSAFYVGINRWPNEEEDNFSDISNDALDLALEEDSAAEENHNFDGEEDHLRERDIEDPGPDAVQFDTNLPAEHSYLGNNMNRVSGVEYLETNRVHRIMLFLHHHIVYPGEVIPFMIPGFIIEDDIDSSNGLLFGLAFPNVRCVKTLAMYGVTCQIYEKGDGERGQTMIKARALQRFVTMSDTRREHLEYITSTPHVKTQGNVKVLPEIYLPEILSTVNLGSMNRFRDIPQLECLIKDFQATTTVWPKYIYNQYNIKMLVEKVIKSLEAHKVESMPHDPVRLSFWLSRNAHFSDEQLKSIFTTDSVNLRMKIISDSFNDAGIFICRFCRNQIAACRDLFAMSKHGVQSQYCNSAGFIHETNTVYKVFSNAVTFSGEPSSEFSWFPGYEWTIIVCKICSRHIGWQFRASVRNLTPALFYGITGASVRIDKGEKRRALRDHLLLNNLIQLVDLQ